ncbi:MAG TPA: NUDIX hydrolase [Ktedonosporobacter sp.]|nr:NUDIX hydrolase [Ktedonosporobacter sp.]
MLYDLLKKCVSIFFNVLNRLLGGKLPPFSSAGVVVEENGRYLVVELPHNHIVFPGGYMTWRENPQEGAAREGREETGLTLQVEGLIGYYPLISNQWTTMSNMSFVYSARVIGGELKSSMEGRALWLPEQELRARFGEHSLRVLDDYLLYREQSHASVAPSKSRTLLPVAS